MHRMSEELPNVKQDPEHHFILGAFRSSFPYPTHTMLVMQHILHTQVYDGIPFLAIHPSSSLDLRR